MWARMFVRFICIICFLLILLVVMDLLMPLFDMPWPVVVGAMVWRLVLSPICAFAEVTAKTLMVAAAKIGRYRIPSLLGWRGTLVPIGSPFPRLEMQAIH
jgi:hypothetical protein